MKWRGMRTGGVFGELEETEDADDGEELEDLVASGLDHLCEHQVNEERAGRDQIDEVQRGCHETQPARSTCKFLTYYLYERKTIWMAGPFNDLFNIFLCTQENMIND